MAKRDSSSLPSQFLAPLDAPLLDLGELVAAGAIEGRRLTTGADAVWDSRTKRWRPSSPPAKMKEEPRETAMTLHGQFDLFGEPAPVAGVAPGEHPDAGRVRARLLGLLAEARSATAMPWPAAKVRLYQTIFPQMACWLPDAEAATLRGAFEAEIARLRKGDEAAAAA